VAFGHGAQGLTAMSRVSFVIPVYNSAAGLRAAIDSCLAQRWPDVEVVAVDDGSTDDSARILRSYGSRIRVVSQPNAGCAAARNAGLRVATGPFIAWMDADDVALPDRVALGMAALGARADAVLVSSDFSAFTDERGVYEVSHARSYYNAMRRAGGAAALYPEAFEIPAGDGRAAVRVGDIHETLLRGNFVHPPTVLARREAMARAGLHDPALRDTFDYDLIWRMAALGPCAYIEAPLLHYRRSPSQMSASLHEGRTPLEVAALIERFRHVHPEAARRAGPLVRQRLAGARMSAAESLGHRNFGRALAQWSRSMALAPAQERSLRVLAKILLPDRVADVLRQHHRAPETLSPGEQP
jgi:GT2 family glycosyltransferase